MWLAHLDYQFNIMESILKNNGAVTDSVTASSLYERLAADREPYITRAERCAELTIPYLFPKKGSNGSTEFLTPYQSIGARGVRNLASKLLLALMPPNSAFFKLEVLKNLLENLGEQRAEVDQKLVQMEQLCTKFMESKQYRTVLFEALQQLVVTGNALLFLDPQEGQLRSYRLNSYVVQRDTVGHIVNIVTKDCLSVNTLPKDVLKQLKGTLQDATGVNLSEVDIYTHVKYNALKKSFDSYQECKGIKLKGYDQSYPEDTMPWLPLRLIRTDGEHYSRSYVETYLGDLRSLEGLAKAIVEGSAIAATCIFLVNQNGQTQVSKLQKTKNGGFCPGKPEDIQPLQIQKSQDFAIAKSTMDAIEQRLAFAFLLNSAVQRDAERVTAEEIRYIAGELNDTVGSVYSILSQELQLPLIKAVINHLQKKGLLAELPKDLVQPSITTGVSAISRGHDLNKITSFMNIMKDNQFAAQIVNWPELIKALANACDINTEGLIKTNEQVQAEQQQAQQQAQMAELASKAAPNIAGGAMKMLENDQLAQAQMAQQAGEEK